MFKKYIRPFIIMTIQILLPGLLFLSLAPVLIHYRANLNQIQHFLSNHKIGFLLFHSIFYLALLFLWPIIIRIWVNQSPNDINPLQIKSALTARWYLFAGFLFFELLYWWR